MPLPMSLHLLPGDGDSVGEALVKDPRVDGVAFTGGTDTGMAINRALAARDGADRPSSSPRPAASTP